VADLSVARRTRRSRCRCRGSDHGGVLADQIRVAISGEVTTYQRFYAAPAGGGTVCAPDRVCRCWCRGSDSRVLVSPMSVGMRITGEVGGDQIL